MKQQPASKTRLSLSNKKYKAPPRRRTHPKVLPRHVNLEQLRRIVDHMPFMLVALDDHNEVAFWNREVERVTGYSSRDIHNKSTNWLHRIFPDETYRLYIYNRLTNCKESFRNWEWDIVCKDGSHKTVSLSSTSNLFPRPGWKIWAVGFDASEQKKVENALREALIWSNSILETSMSGYYAYCMDGKIDTCNEAFCQQTGYSREELLEMNIHDLQIELTDQEFEEQNDLIIGNGRYHFESSFHHKDGSYSLLEINASFLFTDDGGRFVCFARDITWRRLTEKALRQSQERYRLISDNIYDVIWTLDLQGNFTYISPSIERLSDFNVNEVMDKGFDLILPLNSLRQLHNIIRDVQLKINGSLHEPISHRLEFQHKHKNGSFIWVEVLISVIFDENGACYGILGVTHDIHQRKLMEIAEHQQRRLSEALAASAAAMNSHLEMNEVLKQILINIGDVVSHDSANFSLIDPDSGSIHVIRMTIKPGSGFEISEKELELGLDDIPNLKIMYETGEPVICHDTLSDPNWKNTKNVGKTRSYAGVPVRIKEKIAGFLNLESFSPNFFNEEHAHRLKIFADQAATAIENAQLFETALKQLIEREHIARAEHEQRVLAEALRASAAVLNSTLDLHELLRRILVEVSRVVPHDVSNVILLDDCNHINKITTGKGYPPVHEKMDEIFLGQPVKHFNDLQTAFEARQQLIIKDVLSFPGWQKNPDLPWMRSQIITPIFVQDEISGFINLGSAEPDFFDEELAERLVVFADHAATAIQNAELYAAMQHELETRKKMQESLMASQKLAALGTMAAGIAHEINSPLQTITGISDSILSRLEKDRFNPQELPASILTISRNGWRVAGIIQSILTYAQASKNVTESVDVNELIRHALQIAAERCHNDGSIHFQTELTPDMPLFVCDREQITLVLLNLISNACDSMPGGGYITLSSAYNHEARRFILSICDTGIGIPLEIQDRIFDPFFTTKPVGQGTGLGLAISMSIIHAHNGDIRLESTPGKGTCFILSFPNNIQDFSDSTFLNQYGRYSDVP